MAISFNRITLAGNIGNVAVRQLQSGKVANLSLATTERYTDRSGQRQEITSWHQLVAYGNQVDIIEQYVHKGDPLLIEGALNYRTYTDKNGVEKTMAQIKILAFQMLGGHKDAAPSSGAEPRQAAPARSTAPTPPPSDDEDYPDDLPF